MLKIYAPLVIVLGLIISVLAYIKHFNTLGVEAGINKTKLENIIIVNDDVMETVKDLMKIDYENLDRIEKNETVALPIDPASCSVSGSWLQKLDNLK